MILAKPILTALLMLLVGFYLLRLRSSASDALLVMVCFAIAVVLVLRPDLANQLAHVFGIGRGVDLVFYFAIPGLAVMVLILFARTREINTKLTATIREYAILNAVNNQANSGKS